MRRISLLRMGEVALRDALKTMDCLSELREKGSIGDALLICAHPPTYTIGKRGKREDVKLSERQVRDRGIEVVDVPRGGQATYHGPGQVILYPIVSVRDLRLGARKWIEGLEDSMVETTRAFGVESEGRRPGASGVWIGQKKIGAVGVRISRGVSSHGLSYNVDIDLSAYEPLIACGFVENVATSLTNEVSEGVETSSASEVLVECFLKQFNFTCVPADDSTRACLPSVQREVDQDPVK